MLIAANILTHCNVNNLRNILAGKSGTSIVSFRAAHSPHELGLYLCSAMYSYIEESGRYVPEVAAFLNSVASLFAPQDEVRFLQNCPLPQWHSHHGVSGCTLQVSSAWL